ncbi:hypothetical protein AB205_0120680 [Aquarana catesbeiana]|uniref:Sulfotransferase n=1 Tax=Aquarana catesbeiana TaxID=8400 RepID=A0A2G9S1H5_AQUCT|nr:hypothetical protein AB205_0120680 [Aquarana catesbeiana]
MYMEQDIRSNVVKICKFLGKDLDDAAIDSVVEHSSFKAMKANNMSNYSTVPNEIFNKDQGSFYRKGPAAAVVLRQCGWFPRIAIICESPEGFHTGAMRWQDSKKSPASSIFGAVKERSVYRSFTTPAH